MIRSLELGEESMESKTCETSRNRIGVTEI